MTDVALSPSSSCSCCPASYLPTAFLPPLKTHPSTTRLTHSLTSLQKLYCSVRTEADGDTESLTVARADSNEKRYAINWCIKLLGSDLSWLNEEVDSARVEQIYDLASSVIAADAAVEEAGEIERLFRFPLQQHDSSSASTPSGSVSSTPAVVPYEIKIRDAPLPISQRRQSQQQEQQLRDETTSADPSSDEKAGGSDGEIAATPTDHIGSRAQDAAAAVGVQTWGGAAMLSDLLSRAPGEMHSSLSSEAPLALGLNILELGAGTGLVGMLAARVAERCLLAPEHHPKLISEADGSDGKAHVQATLTDYHELVLSNLRENIALNFFQDENAPKEEISIDWKTLDWCEVDGHLHERVTINSPSFRWWHAQSCTYDVILAADVIYSPQHPRWLLSCFQYFLSRTPTSRAHLLCPIRLNGRFGEWNLIEIADKVFREAASDADDGKEVVLLERRELSKKKGIGRDDESGYVYWVFGIQGAAAAA